MPGIEGIDIPFGNAGMLVGMFGIPFVIAGFALRCAAAILAACTILPHRACSVVLVRLAIADKAIGVPLLSRLPFLPVASPVVSVPAGKLETPDFCESTAA
jgi:hypothetical protein